jgi:hypothetical protein
MRIITHWKSSAYDPANVRRRYVRATSGSDEYRYIEVGEDPRYDILQGSVAGRELPPDIKRKADELKTQCWGYVELPK